MENQSTIFPKNAWQFSYSKEPWLPPSWRGVVFKIINLIGIKLLTMIIYDIMTDSIKLKHSNKYIFLQIHTDFTTWKRKHQIMVKWTPLKS